MDHDRVERHSPASKRTRLLRSTCLAPLMLAVLAIGAGPEGPAATPALAQTTAGQLPAPPANGVMGFVVHYFAPSVLQDEGACPEGPALKNREIFLASLTPAERERLQLKANEQEFGRRWRDTLVGPNNTNICTQPHMFPDRPLQRTVQSQNAWGLNLDGDETGASGSSETCAHTNFTTPTGERGIDNQAYRAMGCNLEWRGVDGTAGDIIRGYNGFQASGEFTQVLLLHGVDSLVRDDNVEVIYGNTPDRPVVDSTGKFVHNASFTISTKPPRHRNVLRGRIVNGVLTTEPTTIQLTQTWGQGGARDLRGARGKWDLRRGRLRLTFQPDGTLKGLVGGYEPIADLIISPSLGGLGSALVAGIDCAGQYNTVKKYADGLPDPKTGQCTAISIAHDFAAVPAFVNDVPAARKPQRIATR